MGWIVIERVEAPRAEVDGFRVRDTRRRSVVLPNPAPVRVAQTTVEEYLREHGLDPGDFCRYLDDPAAGARVAAEVRR